MQKKLTSLALASTLLLCPAGKLSHADTNEEKVRKIAAILEENENEFRQKLNLEMCKSQELENENKALSEMLQELKAEKANKELKKEIEKLINNTEKSNSPSFWSKTKAFFKDTLSAFLALTVAFGTAFASITGLAGVWTLGSAVYNCLFDKNCKSFSEKLSATTFNNAFSTLASPFKNVHFVFSPGDENNRRKHYEYRHEIRL